MFAETIVGAGQARVDGWVIGFQAAPDLQVFDGFLRLILHEADFAQSDLRG